MTKTWRHRELTWALFAGALALGSAACMGQPGDDGGNGEISTRQAELSAAQSATTDVYQAENAFDIDEGVVESEHPGWTGTGYVNVANAVGSRIWFVVGAPGTTSATLRIRYANGASMYRPIQVVVNGRNGPVMNGGSTGAWTTWVTVSTTVNLTKGNNDLLLVSTMSDGLPNIDRIELVQNFSQTLQAENAFAIEDGVVETIHSGYTGTGYVNVHNSTDSFIWHVVQSGVAGPVRVAVRYANGATVGRPIQVSANGNAGVNIPGAATGAWTNWVTGTVTINLEQGINDLFLTSVTSDGMPNIDSTILTW